MEKKLLVAAAVSGLMFAGTMAITPAAHAGEKGECHGVNSCKGTGACGMKATKDRKGHSCHGKNACKGQGWIKLDKKACEAKILEEAKKKGMFFNG